MQQNYYMRTRELIDHLCADGIDKLIAMDFAGFSRIYPDGKVAIDAGAAFGAPIPEQAVRRQIGQHLGEMLQLTRGGCYADAAEWGMLHLIAVPVDRQSGYTGYFILCRAGEEGFCEKDIRAAEFVANNVKDRMELSHAILREKTYFQYIHDSIPTQILTLNTEGRIVSINRALERLIGDRERHIGSTMQSFLTDESHFQVIHEICESVLETRMPVECPVKLSCIDGKVIIDELVIAPLVLENDELIGVILYGTDITEKRIYEREIEQLRQYALLGEFSAYIAHDIKNPLSSIRGITRLMQKDTCSAAEQQEFMEGIITSVDRINGTVEQLLSYARLSSDHQADLANINLILDNCIDAVSFHRQFKQIQIHKHYDSKLPLIRARQLRMEQAFMNILLNAVQAIEDRGSITIVTKYQQDENKITIHFIDDGAGIAAEDSKRIQEPFYTTKPDGTGLGLAIIHRAVEEHGGKLEIESTLGCGTVVKVTLFC